MTQRSVWLAAMAGLILWVLVLGACGDMGDDTEEGVQPAPRVLLDAVPDPMMLYIATPDYDSATGDNLAVFWELTRGVARGVNETVWRELTVPADITPLPPKRADETIAVWELSQPLDGESLTVPSFSIEALSDDTFSYFMRRRHRNAPDAWQIVWYGEMQRDVLTEEGGSGEFVFDFSAASAIDPTLSRSGSVTVEFDAKTDENRELTLTYKDYIAENDLSQTPRDMTYTYLERTDGSGSMAFTTFYNWTDHTDTMETLDVYSDWTELQMGQTDIFISGDDLSAQSLSKVEIRECWDSQLGQTYYVQLYYSLNAAEDDEPARDREAGDVTLCPIGFD